jgi:hypothetical protein
MTEETQPEEPAKPEEKTLTAKSFSVTWLKGPGGPKGPLGPDMVITVWKRTA